MSEFVQHLETKGFATSWSGSAEKGVLDTRKDDQFSGKPTTIAFETEKHPFPKPGACQDGLAVLARAKLNGEVLNWVASEDLVLTLAEQYRQEHPLPAKVTTQASRRAHAAPGAGATDTMEKDVKDMPAM